MSRGNPSVQVRLTKEQVERLRKLAEERKISLSDLIREALRAYLLAEYK